MAGTLTLAYLDEDYEFREIFIDTSEQKMLHRSSGWYPRKEMILQQARSKQGFNTKSSLPINTKSQLIKQSVGSTIFLFFAHTVSFDIVKPVVPKDIHSRTTNPMNQIRFYRSLDEVARHRHLELKAFPLTSIGYSHFEVDSECTRK
jgi:hypothetical protein